MTEQKKETAKECLPRLELSNKPTLTITKELKQKIDFLHKKEGSNEWSGELITKEKGSINDLDSWEIIAQDIFLADVGSPGFTGYEVDKGSFKSSDIIELYEAYPKLLDGKLKLQHLHTHHSMSAFFSGTDWENLEDRAMVSNYFLMLIVNFDGKYCAKVAFKAIREKKQATRLNFANNEDGIEPLELKGEDGKNVLVVMDCKIVVENDTVVSKEFEDRYNRVVATKKAEAEEEKKEREKEKKAFQTKGWRGGVPGTWTNGKFFEDDWSLQGRPKEDQYHGIGNDDGLDYEWRNRNGVWNKEPKNGRKDKKIGDMTEKEWRNSQQHINFDLRHARCFLNSILDGTYMPDNFEDCIRKIVKIDKSLVHEYKRQEWIEDFEILVAEHFDVLFPTNTVNEYSELLFVVLDYLHPYEHIPLVEMMMESVQEELNLLTLNEKLS